MKNFEYSAEEAITLCETMSDEIKTKVKKLEFDRFVLNFNAFEFHLNDFSLVGTK